MRLHENRSEFIRMLERTSAQTAFPLRLLEKDYYLTVILSDIHKLSRDLVFKGGTCLSKVYFDYYRLSEDLDFTLKLPPGEITRTVRRKTIKPVKDSITGFVKGFNLNAQNPEKAGRNESTQYVYYIEYDSVVLNRKETVKLEIGLRFNPVLAPQKHGIKHKFIHPFTKEPLFSGGETACLQLDELVAEKMRAAATRQVIASRDFFDLGYLIETGFDLSRKAVLDILKIKLAEDGFPVDMRKYSFNLGRTEKEIDEMKSHVEDELLSVLSVNERNRFDMQKVLDALNNVFKTVV